MKHWTLDDIEWEKFDSTKVDPDLLKVMKAASLVEKNGHDYGRYLQKVFDDDPEFSAAAIRWAAEEVQHGDALGRWSELADPSFNFQAAFEDFATNIKLPIDVGKSVRGSRVGELVARCVVECGTSSMYSAISAATEEPVLKQICQKIAADELRHYKLFYKHEKRYLEIEKVGKFRRFWVALTRAAETEDDELAYAYFAANKHASASYDRKTFNREYSAKIYGFYRFHHVERAMSMAFKAAGLKPHGRLCIWISKALHAVLKKRARLNQKLVAAQAKAV
ncbi:MAG: ferritin-like domain-containing protein [Rhodospirillaceae bacterium]|nr:ferritin-like domain-containing protein [Rhodospirillaceae bacterium]